MSQTFLLKSIPGKDSFPPLRIDLCDPKKSKGGKKDDDYFNEISLLRENPKTTSDTVIYQFGIPFLKHILLNNTNLASTPHLKVSQTFSTIYN